MFQKPGNYIAVIANGSRFLREVGDGRVLQNVTFTPLLHNNGLLMVNSYGNFQEASRRIRFRCLCLELGSSVQHYIERWRPTKTRLRSEILELISHLSAMYYINGTKPRIHFMKCTASEPQVYKHWKFKYDKWEQGFLW